MTEFCPVLSRPNYCDRRVFETNRTQIFVFYNLMVFAARETIAGVTTNKGKKILQGTEKKSLGRGVGIALWIVQPLSTQPAWFRILAPRIFSHVAELIVCSALLRVRVDSAKLNIYS